MASLSTSHKRTWFPSRAAIAANSGSAPRDRYANTAGLYAQLGLTKYAAMEAFVRWHY